MMQPAADAMEKALADARIDAPLVPVFANVTAQPVSDVDTIRKLLVEQVTGMVRWRESVLNMADAGVDRISSNSAARCSARWSSASRPTSMRSA